MSRPDESIDGVRQLERSDLRLTVRMVAEELDMNGGSGGTISVQEFGMQNACAKVVPMLLTADQKEPPVALSLKKLLAKKETDYSSRPPAVFYRPRTV